VLKNKQHLEVIAKAARNRGSQNGFTKAIEIDNYLKMKENLIQIDEEDKEEIDELE